MCPLLVSSLKLNNGIKMPVKQSGSRVLLEFYYFFPEMFNVV